MTTVSTNTNGTTAASIWYEQPKADTTVTKTKTITEKFDADGNITERITEEWEETITKQAPKLQYTPVPTPGYPVPNNPLYPQPIGPVYSLAIDDNTTDALYIKDNTLAGASTPAKDDRPVSVDVGMRIIPGCACTGCNSGR